MHVKQTVSLNKSGSRLKKSNSLPNANQIYWLGPRGEDALPLLANFPLKNIICANYSSLLQELASEINIYSAEQQIGLRKRICSADMPLLFSSWLSNVNQPTDAVVIFPYVAIATMPPIKSMGPNYQIVRSINYKPLQRHFFKKWKFLTPESLLIKHYVDYKKLQSLLRTTELGVQSPVRGSQGRGIKRVNIRELLTCMDKHSSPQEPYLISAFVPGISVNTAMVVTPDYIHCGWPSVQILGEPLSRVDSEFGYCGNNFSATHDFPAQDIATLATLATRLGQHFAAMGYVGYLGADWIYDHDGKWWLIEVNPRLQGSSLALSLFENAVTKDDLFTHLLAKPSHSRKNSLKPFAHPVHGMQLNLFSDGIIKLTSEVKLQLSLLEKDWQLVGFPIPGTVAEPHAELGKIITTANLPMNGNQLQSISRKYITRYFAESGLDAII